jgi:deoxyribose-phosphate aldolase
VSNHSTNLDVSALLDSNIAAIIDHTILRADATRQDVIRVCQEAKKYNCASVCVNGCWVPVVASELAGTQVKVCTVVGFPLGAMSTDAKRVEAELAIRSGAHEIDMVLNIGALKSSEPEVVRSDIEAVAKVCHAAGAILKVILETAVLTDAEKVSACELAKAAGAHFVKTSTGFGPGGATVEDVALLRRTVGPDMGVKASGGIRTIEDLRRMLAAGANRVGASATVNIVNATAS